MKLDYSENYNVTNSVHITLKEPSAHQQEKGLAWLASF